MCNTSHDTGSNGGRSPNGQSTWLGVLTCESVAETPAEEAMQQRCKLYEHLQYVYPT